MKNIILTVMLCFLTFYGCSATVYTMDLVQEKETVAKAALKFGYKEGFKDGIKIKCNKPGVPL